MNITGLIISLIVLVIALILIFWLRTPEAKKQTDSHEPTVAVRPSDMKIDDLTLIEGIGPKIKTILNQAGIRTFADLSQKPHQELVDILGKANIRISDPETWPEQAGLLEVGKLDELKALQEKLRGGRRV